MGRPAKYPEQFRRDAVELVESSKRPIAEVARSLSINECTLWNWVRDARRKQAGDADPTLVSESERDELRRLRKEVIDPTSDQILMPRGRPDTGPSELILETNYAESIPSLIVRSLSQSSLSPMPP